MPRPLRFEFANAWNHVMNRGAARKRIFKTVNDRTIFLSLLGDITKLFGIEIHAYCLMDNHYHILLKTPRGNLSRAMRHLNGVYTQCYNRLVKRDGALFRGRYKAIVVDGNNYLLQVSRYIHLNPIVAKIVNQPQQYIWSSYRDYINKNKKSGWLVTDEILSMTNPNKKNFSYKNFVMKGLDAETEKFYAKNNTSSVYGNKIFKEKLLKMLDDNEIKSSKTDYKRTQELPSIDEIDNSCARHFHIDKFNLYKSQRGAKNDSRKIAIYACRVWGSEKLSIIAERYHCTHTNISNIVREIGQRILVDKRLALVIEQLRKLIFN
jgi:REP element-mobilizing transposase RayT